MIVQASITITQLLEKLFENWERWDQNREFYIHTLLPDLMAYPNKGTSQEKVIIHKIKKAASTEEWRYLEEIAEHLEEQKKRNRDVSEVLNQFFITKDYQAAKSFVTENPDPAILSLYEKKRAAAISRTMMKVQSCLEQFKFHQAEEAFSYVQPYALEAEISKYRSLVAKKQQALIQSTMPQIKKACQTHNFHDAELLYSQIADYVPRKVIDALIEKAKRQQEAEQKQRFVDFTINEIQSLLYQYEFSKADEKYWLIKDEYSREDYQDLVQFYRQQQEREKVISLIETDLRSGQFLFADQLFLNSNLLSKEEYIHVKRPYIQRYVRGHYGVSINEEKAEALAYPGGNLLLSARAGSGKTTVLACKTSLLIDTENVDPDQILVMAFNRKAAEEIRSRIQEKFKQPDFDNARTFHSLAHQLVHPDKGILFDENDDVRSRKLSLFVQQIVKYEIRRPDVIEKMYDFFRREMLEADNAGFFKDRNDYFIFRRSMLQTALNGEKVKSIGEKYIADYLYEHDIAYGYEKVWFWGSRIYRPGFSIYDQQTEFVIEHWDIDENDPQKQVPPGWTQTWDEEYTEILEKRSFWRGRSVILIETSVRDLQDGREAFEAVLEKKLIEAGIFKRKLSQAELIEKIKDRDYIIIRLSELFTQFVQQAKKQMLKPYDVQIQIQSYQPENDREEFFLEFACRIYLNYEQELARQNKIDFDDLMMKAIEKVHETQGECRIKLGNNRDRSIRMNDLRWILVDEYQDFSQLFHQLVTAIQHYNPQVRLFCVGDDWQAINGFAGSDLKYFYKFKSWVEGAQIAHLQTNFRSQAAIVQHGNALMKGFGKPGEHLPQNRGGEVHIEYVDDIWMELRNSDFVFTQKTEDERFLISEIRTNGRTSKFNRIVASKYLKLCYEIAARPKNRGKSIAILSRTNWIDGVRLDVFKNELLAAFTQEDLELLGDIEAKIDVQTAHKYKGMEADLVIILGACDGQFPLLHPDNALFKIFGKTLADVFEEERRLFYVALTRAKETLWILTEKGCESAFLKKLLVNSNLWRI